MLLANRILRRKSRDDGPFQSADQNPRRDTKKPSADRHSFRLIFSVRKTHYCGAACDSYHPRSHGDGKPDGLLEFQEISYVE